MCLPYLHHVFYEDKKITPTPRPSSCHHWHAGATHQRQRHRAPHSAADRRTLYDPEPLCPCHRDRRRNRCRYFSPAGPDHGHRHGFPRHQVQRKDEGQSRRRRLGRSSHRLRCPCRSGPPLQPSETTDPPTTGRYLPGQSHQLAASGRRRPQNRSLLPRDFLRYLRVLQGKRTEKQELHEQQSLHACHGSHYPIRQPNSRSHRICGSSLCITAYQDTRRFIRRAALCRSHAGECHQ